MRTDRFYAAAVALYCTGIFAQSHRPVPPELARFSFEGADKLAHMVMYGGLAALVALTLRAAPRRHSPRMLWLAPVLFATLYGASDEVHQSFVDGRTADMADLAADFAGAVTAQVLLCGLRWRIPVPWGRRQDF